MVHGARALFPYKPHSHRDTHEAENILAPSETPAHPHQPLCGAGQNVWINRTPTQAARSRPHRAVDGEDAEKSGKLKPGPITSPPGIRASLAWSARESSRLLVMPTGRSAPPLMIRYGGNELRRREGYKRLDRTPQERVAQTPGS